MVAVERLLTTDEVLRADPLFREYVDWGRDRLVTEFGVVWSDADVERMHDGFRAEWPKLIEDRGRIYLAVVDEIPAGVGALKPLSATAAEVKRVFVRPHYRGQGIARTLMVRLLDDARSLGFETVRLDTMPFMTDAHRLYESLGFVRTAPYDGEGLAIGLGLHAIYMEVSLGDLRSSR